MVQLLPRTFQKSQGGHKPGKLGILGDFSENGKIRELWGILCNVREKL